MSSPTSRLVASHAPTIGASIASGGLPSQDLFNPPKQAASQDDQTLAPTQTNNTSGVTAFTPIPNLLKEFASVNPVLTLMVTTPINYVNMMNAQQYDASKWYPICKSGGVGPNKATGINSTTSKYFSKDLYIDEVDIETIAGFSQENRGSNATTINFTIVEPYGMDLIEQLFDFCGSGLNEPSYTQIPYMLVIDFMGWKQDGSFSGQIPGASKYIPIRLMNMSITLNNLGSIYKVEAIAYNETGNTEQLGRIDKTFEVSGATISDYANGLLNTLNDQQKALVNDPKILAVPDVYSIKFITGEIGASTTDTEIWTGKNDPPVARDVPSPAPANTALKVAQNTGQFATNDGSSLNAVSYSSKGKIAFNAGSSIIDCLNQIIINSKYITDQIKKYNALVDDANKKAAAAGANYADDSGVKSALDLLSKTPLNWFIIIPFINPKTYDNVRNTYSHDIVFTVRPYPIYNSRSISAPNSDPSSRCVKEYDYIFTGNNTEVISFELAFNNAFITYAQVNAYQKTQGTGGGLPDTPMSTGPNTTGAPVVQPKQSATPAGGITVPSSSNTKPPSGIGQNDAGRTQASDVASTIYAPAEQLQLDLTIQGDPDFIKQDGIFINPPSYNSAPYLASTGTNVPGGIMFNTGEIYANVNFKIPQDISLSTGTLDLAFAGDSKSYNRNVFSGYYRVVSISNKIDKAKFTQKLSMVRYDGSHDFTLGPPSTATSS